MVRKVVAAGMLVAGLALVILGTLAEIDARSAYEPVFEQGVIVGAAVIVASILAFGAYLLWPKSD